MVELVDRLSQRELVEVFGELLNQLDIDTFRVEATVSVRISGNVTTEDVKRILRVHRRFVVVEEATSSYIPNDDGADARM